MSKAVAFPFIDEQLHELGPAPQTTADLAEEIEALASDPEQVPIEEEGDRCLVGIDGCMTHQQLSVLSLCCLAPGAAAACPAALCCTCGAVSPPSSATAAAVRARPACCAVSEARAQQF